MWWFGTKWGPSRPVDVCRAAAGPSGFGSREARHARRNSGAPLMRSSPDVASQCNPLKAMTEIEEACASIERATGHDLDTEAGRFVAPRAHRRAAATVVRQPRPRRGARDVARTGLSWGPLPGVPPARHRGPPRLDRQPDVLGGRAPGVGTYVMPRLTARLQRDPPAPGAPRAAARRAHRRDPGRGAGAKRGRDRAVARRRRGRRARRPPGRAAPPCAGGIGWGLSAA